MSMKKGTSHATCGRGRELQALLDSSVVPIADKDDAAGQIPWRTSRRLQEATFRSLSRDRDMVVDHTISVKREKVEKASSELLSPVRLPKRLRSPQSHLEMAFMEESESEGVGGGQCSLYDEESKEGVMNVKRETFSDKRKRSVSFSDPLFSYIESEKKQEEEVLKTPVPEKKVAQLTRKENAMAPKSGASPQPKQPRSCFDLLCNFSGAKGWRCYRSCVEGESFCIQHISSRKSPSIVRISVCT